MERVIVFGDPALFMTAMLLKATLHCASSRTDMRIVAICDAGRKPAAHRTARLARLTAFAWVNTFFNPGRPFLLKKEMLADVHAMARQSGLPVLVPPERDINHPGFIELLQRRIKPTVALSFGCLQIYKPALLNLFDRVVNYHNGRLPRYGGLHATSWALYHDEPRSGYTFHLMDEGIDTGNILLGGSIRVPPKAVSVHIDYLKLQNASRRIADLLDQVAAKNRGEPQSGPARYFSGSDFERITTIADPSALPYAELQRRLRAFDLLRLKIEAAWYRISHLKPCHDGGLRKSRLCFTSADGIRLAPDRFDYKPRWLQRLAGRMIS